MGLYSLRLDITDGEPGAAIEPWRDATALGDSYLLDATHYFGVPACGNCLQVTAIRKVDAQTLDLQLTIRHPFQMPQPPLGPNSRLDLHVFDVQALFLGGETGGPQYFDLNFAKPYLLNADGYTAAYNPLFSGIFPTPGVNVHPFRQFITNGSTGNYSPTNPNGFADLFNPSGHHVLPQGGSAAQVFRLKLPSTVGTISFGSDMLIAILASWAQPSNNQKGEEYLQRGNPVYFLPEGNQKLPWRLSAVLQNNNLAGGDPSSSTGLQVTINDWQWDAVVDTAFPEPARKGEIRQESWPNYLVVDVKGVLGTPITQSNLGGSGRTRTYSYTINNDLSAPEGTRYGIVSVFDSMSLDGKGIRRDTGVPVNLENLRIHQLFEVPIGPGTSTGFFGPAIEMSDRHVKDAGGHFNVNMPELITDGTRLWLGYQDENMAAWITRSLDGGSSFTNHLVYQSTDGFEMEPTLGVNPTGSELHCVLAAPEGTGTYGTISTNHGSVWGGLLEVHDEDYPDDTHAITSGPGERMVIFGIFDLSSSWPALLLGSSTWSGSAFVPRTNPSAVKPHFGEFFRIDEQPMIYRLPGNELLCIFATNERTGFEGGDASVMEPVALRSTDNGVSWSNWTYIRGGLDLTRSNAFLSSTQFGNTCWVVETPMEGAPRIYRSTDGGLTWQERPKPAGFTGVHESLCEIAAKDASTLALIWADPAGIGAASLKMSLSTDGGATWPEPILCDDDPQLFFRKNAASAVFTADGRLHIAMLDNRHFSGNYRWHMVSQLP